MKAYVTIQNFGCAESCTNLATTLDTLINIPVNVGTNSLLIICNIDQLEVLFATLASDDRTNWIEYTIQFDW